MPPCTAGLSRVTTSVCWSRLWVNQSVSSLIILSDKAHKKTLIPSLSPPPPPSLVRRCPLTLNVTSRRCSGTCWMRSSKPSVSADCVRQPQGACDPSMPPSLLKHNIIMLREKKHCGWHFSVSHYLLVLRFARFPSWPLSSNILMFLCTPHSFPDISLLFHRVTVYVCLFCSTISFIFLLSGFHTLILPDSWHCTELPSADVHHPPLSLCTYLPSTLSAVCDSLVM